MSKTRGNTVFWGVGLRPRWLDILFFYRSWMIETCNGVWLALCPERQQANNSRRTRRAQGPLRPPTVLYKSTAKPGRSTNRNRVGYVHDAWSEGSAPELRQGRISLY